MSKQPIRWYYLHTLDGKPAYFSGGQIVYAGGRYPRCKQPLCDSLDQIKREQRQSRSFRREHGWEDNWEYGYVRVTLPEGAK